MKRVKLRPEARQDLDEARLWYADQQAGLDNQLRAHLRILLNRIADHPRLYPRTPHGFARRAPRIGPFPYSVYYREHGDFVEILAILHNARDPEQWRLRAL